MIDQTDIAMDPYAGTFAAQELHAGPLSLVLPFPGAALSPNSRLHWRPISVAKKAYRRDCGFMTKDQARGTRLTGRQRLDFVFFTPNNRAYDRDNLIARMKSGIDGIADALGINDKFFDIGTIEIASKVPEGRVHILITGEGK